MAKQKQIPQEVLVDKPAALEALSGWVRTLDRTAYSRGSRYWREGHVLSLQVHGSNCVEADVEGSQIYVASLILTSGRWTSRCECPMATGCKHVVAAALEWLEQNGRFLNEDVEDPDDFDIGDESPELAKPAEYSTAPGKGSFRSEWTPKLAEKLGRPLTDEEGRQLGHLSALFNRMNQHSGSLCAADLRAEGFTDALPPRYREWEALFRGWWEVGKPPRDPWALWQILAHSLELNGRPIPEALQPVTDTGPVRARLEQLMLHEELSRWHRALAPITESAPAYTRSNPVAAVSGLRLRLDAQGVLHAEQRLTGAKAWKGLGQQALRNFASAFASEFEHLPPAERKLAVVLAEAWRADPYEVGRDLPMRVAGRVLATPEFHPLLVQPGGDALPVGPDALIREARPSADRPDRLDVRLVTPDGRDATAAVRVEAAPANTYLFEGRLWAGPPPVPASSLPVAALADADLLLRIRASGLRLPAGLEPRVETVRLRPTLRIRLTNPKITYEVESLEVELLARSDNPRCEQVWRGNGGWTYTDKGAPRRRPDGPLLEIDLADANRVGARFADFRLQWQDWNGTWRRPVTSEILDEFAVWHASLPPDIDIELSPAVAALLDPPLAATVDFTAIPSEGSGQDWFDLTVGLRVEDTTLRPDELELLLKARGKWVRLKSGWKRLQLGTTAAGEAGAALDRLGLDAADILETGRPSTHRLHALQLAGEVGALEARDAALAARLRERVATLAAVPAPSCPPELVATLRPYQVEGFHFLVHLSTQEFGGVLADDMGLGKTVQTLAWLLELRRRLQPVVPGRRKIKSKSVPNGFRVLVVCPKSVVHGWLAETARFAPSLPIAAYSTAMSAAGASLSREGILVANYTQLRLRAEWFKDQSWDAVVLDEGQFIKNPASQVAVATRSLPARHRLVLTGTPIENRLTDLWSLFAFAQPGLLGGQTAFKRQYPADDPAALARLRRRTRHFLLRRTKAQAAPDLPPRTEDELVVELEPAQRKLYEAELKLARAQLLGISTDRAFDKVRFSILASLLRLRQICCHPALVDPAHAGLPSAKLEALLERLEELREEGHQVLVFSQFVEMLELIRTRLEAAGIGHLMLTGATENRAELVHTFQTDRSRTAFLLSLKAAGFGLNLTAASYVVLYDPWWNPAVEAQAIDRTHRIGQTRPVIAYRLLAADTIEQKIRALQKEKGALAAAVVQEESLASVLDLESLRRILL